MSKKERKTNTSISKLEKELYFRHLKPHDITSLEKIYDGTYDLEVSGNNITERVVLDGEDVVAFGVVKEFAEAVLVLDQETNKRKKLAALEGLLLRAIQTCKELKLKDLHIFAQKEDFAQLLIKQYGFQRITSIPLVKDLRNGQE